MRRALVVIPLVALASGCGNARQTAPDVFTPGPPIGGIKVAYPKAGLSFYRPGGWAIVEGGAQYSVATISTATAVIGIWRYPRPLSQLPATAQELDSAVSSLVQAAKARDPTFVALKSAHLTISGKPAVQVRGTETVDGQQRMVRSTHIYADSGEVVVDAFCQVKDFKRVDAQVFRPLLQTLKVTPPRAAS